MNKKQAFGVLIFFLFAFSFLFSNSVFAKPNIKTGLWKFTAKVNMPGMTYEMPAVTNEKCLSEKDLIPKTESPDQSCKIKNKVIKGNTVTYDITCEQKGSKTSGHAKMAYNGKKMNGIMDLKLTPGDMKMTTKITGVYVGACKK